MTRLALVLVFISILGIRLVTGQPERIVEGTRVRLTIPTIDYPEHTDSQTVIKRAEWEVRVKGYTDFMPGDIVEVEGVVDERGRVIDSKVESIKYRELEGVDWGLVQIAKLRYWAVGRLQGILPEPQASLAIGILLGVKRSMPREFYDMLVKTGTLHVIAASGYNVSVVAAVVMGALTGILSKQRSLMLGIAAIGGYVLLSGASPSVVRAGVMGSLTLIGVILGRVNDARWLLWVTSWIMLMVKPDLIADIGFQLSLSATVGLLYVGEILKSQILKFSNWKWIQDYLIPTLAATVATAPVIWWHFGRVSLIGVLVNLLILPVVPVIMLLSALSVFVAPLSYLLYVPLWWMAWVIRAFGGDISL
ncbi:ComEC/Rec2 family competence protein [Candidatus Woesebacteria bacterium]|nr:ComEC/Rec2 family competence protein [Candidatus Woesebacteria bacterium]